MNEPSFDEERGLDDWLEALAGHGSAESPDAREGAAIRAAILAQLAESGDPMPGPDPFESDDGDAPDAPPDQAGLEALLERLRREGLLDPAPLGTDTGTFQAAAAPRPQPIRRRPRRNRIAWSGGLAVAATLVLAVLVPNLIHGPGYPPLVAQQSANFDDAPRLREIPGAHTGVVASDPDQIARLIERLKTTGVPYRLREQEDTWRLDFYVSDTSRADASEWLSAQSIVIPPSGWVRLEVAKPAD